MSSEPKEILMKILDGKVALVTGAARGIGWGIGRALGLVGAKVCISDINDAELARAEADLKADGSEVMALHLDVSDLKAFQSAVDSVARRWGRLDAIVQNAVYMPLIQFEDTSEDLWWRQLNISLGGIFNATRAAWDLFKAQAGGHIIGIASGSSVRGFKREVTYCTGKHGQEGFVKAVSLEAAKYNIAINTIGPGATVKPTDVTWEEYDALPQVVKDKWADVLELGKGFVWLIHQPTSRFSGYRFDAGPIALSVNREGYDFEFTPAKVTLSTDDFIFRENWYNTYPDYYKA
jgi:Dehydrogenases with different specificities (related to short-chain alcohol dehydrogenases)